MDARFMQKYNLAFIAKAVEGKTDTNGKPFERQKRTYDERLTNGP